MLSIKVYALIAFIIATSLATIAQVNKVKFQEYIMPTIVLSFFWLFCLVVSLPILLASFFSYLYNKWRSR